VQTIAGKLQRGDPALVDELIQRWTGTRQKFCQV
jgi:hypothetical protein